MRAVKNYPILQRILEMGLDPHIRKRNYRDIHRNYESWILEAYSGMRDRFRSHGLDEIYANSNREERKTIAAAENEYLKRAFAIVKDKQGNKKLNKAYREELGRFYGLKKRGRRK